MKRLLLLLALLFACGRYRKGDIVLVQQAPDSGTVRNDTASLRVWSSTRFQVTVETGDSLHPVLKAIHTDGNYPRIVGKVDRSGKNGR